MRGRGAGAYWVVKLNMRNFKLLTGWGASAFPLRPRPKIGRSRTILHVKFGPLGFALFGPATRARL